MYTTHQTHVPQDAQTIVFAEKTEKRESGPYYPDFILHKHYSVCVIFLYFIMVRKLLRCRHRKTK